MTFFTRTGCHRVQIVHFFRMQIGSRTLSGVGLVVGSRLCRIRHRCGSLELPESPGILPSYSWFSELQWRERELVDYAPSPGACGVGACARLVPSISGPRETSGPRIDRIPPARPSWPDRQYRELKKLFFSPPSKCPIDLFGPVANRTILERLHVALPSGTLHTSGKTPP